MRNLATLPKAHLHLHLDGAIRERTLRDLCAQRGAEPPELPIAESYRSFEVFMDAITKCHETLCFPDNLARIVSEVIEEQQQMGRCGSRYRCGQASFVGD